MVGGYENNILEQGGLWDVICLGVRRGLLKAVYLVRAGESWFWGGVK